MKGIAPLLLFLFCWLAAKAQPTVMKNKHTWGLEVTGGTSFPNFPAGQHDWRAGIYPAGAFSAFLSKRMTKHLSIEVAGGITAYVLVNKSPVESYVLDFASPHLMAGMEYHRKVKSDKETFLRFSPGAQLGYTQTLVSQHSTYTVYIEGEDQFYVFGRADAGFRKNVRLPKKVGGQWLAYELSAFYRHNVNRLGKVRFVTGDRSVTIRPRGSIMGLAIRIVLPRGKERFQAPEETLPSRFHTPRTL